MAQQNDKCRKRLTEVAAQLTEDELKDLDDLFNSGMATDAKRKLRQKEVGNAVHEAQAKGR